MKIKYYCKDCDEYVDDLIIKNSLVNQQKMYLETTKNKMKGGETLYICNLLKYSA